MPSADLFSKSFFPKSSLRNTIIVSNSLDPDHARHFIGPDLVPNCLQNLSADDTGMQSVKDVLSLVLLTMADSRNTKQYR